MSLTPALDELEARKKREEIELCGKNRGPHDYIPIEWSESSIVSGKVVEGIIMKRVTKFLCRVCFNNVDTSLLLSSYRAISS
jgi:hypothetical protein